MTEALKAISQALSDINRPLGDMAAYRTDWEAFSDAHAATLKQIGVAMTGVAKLIAEQAEPWADKPDQWQDAIAAAHPTKTGKHKSYAMAVEMVGNRRSKGALVELVNWLLAYRRIAEQDDPLALLDKPEVIKDVAAAIAERMPLLDEWTHRELAKAAITAIKQIVKEEI